MKNRLKTWFWRWGPAILMMAGIFLFSSIPAAEMPNYGSVDYYIKKGGHMVGYALLGVSYWRGLGDAQKSRWRIAWLLAVGYAVTDEFHQFFVLGRTARFLDVGIDATGALIGLSMLRLLRLLTKL